MSAKLKHMGLLLGFAAIVMVAAGGCSKSPEDRIYEAFKCGKAATMLGYEKEAAQAIATIEADLNEVSGESSIARTRRWMATAMASRASSSGVRRGASLQMPNLRELIREIKSRGMSAFDPKRT